MLGSASMHAIAASTVSIERIRDIVITSRPRFGCLSRVGVQAEDYGPNLQDTTGFRRASTSYTGENTGDRDRTLKKRWVRTCQNVTGRLIAESGRQLRQSCIAGHIDVLYSAVSLLGEKCVIGKLCGGFENHTQLTSASTSQV